MEITLLGAALGFAAGVSPGPLLTLVVASALERGFGAGARVALAPVLTDAPIVLVALYLLKDLPELFLRGVTVVGGLFVIYLGLRTARLAYRPPAPGGASPATDLWRGALVNFFNPHPWLFWMSAGGPLLVAGWRLAPWRGIGFLAGFYLFIVGTKLAVAGLAARGRRLLSEAWYPRVLAAAALLLVVLGLLLLRQAASGIAAAVEEVPGFAGDLVVQRPK